MSQAPPEFLVVGHINKAHGTKGELFVWPLTDHMDAVFTMGARLRLGDEDGQVERVPPREMLVTGVRPFRGGVLVHFEGVPDRTAAELLRGRYLLQGFEEVPEREGDEYFYHELLGNRVVGPDGAELGVVREVYELRPAHMLDVERDQGGSLLIPLTSDVVKRVDLASGVIEVDPPEGLLDL